MRGISYRCRGPHVRWSQLVDSNTQGREHVHQPVGVDAVTGWRCEQRLLVLNDRGMLVDRSNPGSADVAVPPDWPSPPD